MSYNQAEVGVRVLFQEPLRLDGERVLVVSTTEIYGSLVAQRLEILG